MTSESISLRAEHQKLTDLNNVISDEVIGDLSKTIDRLDQNVSYFIEFFSKGRGAKILREEDYLRCLIMIIKRVGDVDLGYDVYQEVREVLG